MGEFRVLTVFWTWQRRSNLPPSSKLSKMSELKAPQTEATDAADHLAALHAAHSLALDELRARTDALQLQLTVADLVAAGAVRKGQPVKVLGQGDISVAVQVKVQAFSGSAQEKIAAAGGSIEKV